MVAVLAGKPILKTAGLAVGLALAAHANDIVVSAKADLPNALASANPGDRIVFTEGTWADAQIQVSRSGAPGQPIKILARTPGKTVFTGSSRLVLDGKYLEASGFLFQGASTRDGTNAAIEFTANSSECAVTQTAVDGYNAKGGSKDNWVNIWGLHNRVEYCSFAGKNLVGELMRIRRDANQSDQHVIAHNYFGARPPVNGNGGEEIQIGLKETQFTASNSIVEHNLFEDCDGEAEMVSLKSGGNIVRFNTLVRCLAHITCRHGAGNAVIANYIDGGGKDGTGGIRVCNKNHIIAMNFITGLRGSDGFGGAIILHSGDNTDPVKDPANHVPAQNVLVAYNTLVDNLQGVIYGDGGALAPSGITFSDNLVSAAPGGSTIAMNTHNPFAAAEGDILFGASSGIDKLPGILVTDPMLAKTTLNGYPYFQPATGSPALAKAVGVYEIPGWSNSPRNIGENAFGAGLQPLVRSDVGPAWNGGANVATRETRMAAQHGASLGRLLFPGELPDGLRRDALGRLGALMPAGRP